MSFGAVAFIFLFIIFSQTSGENDPRIVEGEESTSGRFPYMVGFYYVRGETTGFCGGSIISSRYILTAAHCIQNATRLTIHMGTNNLAQPGPTGFVVTSTEYVTHPNYDPLTLGHDIGVIWLSSPLVFNVGIQPIELAARPLDSFQAVTVLGWGASNDAETSPKNTLYHVPLTTMSNADCMRIYSIRETMVCATGTGNQGTCRGDSGGPLVQTDANGKDTHVAVATFHSGYGCETDQPSGFTRTFDYLDWIKDVTEEESPAPPPPDGSTPPPSSASTLDLVLPLSILLSIFYWI